MVCVFFQLPKLLGAFPAPMNPVNTRAATAAAEVTSTFEWIIEVDS